MLDLTFFTTNMTKLAHARYVGEGRNVAIKGFRQRTYHADYLEPRLLDRDALLRESYQSAVRQCEKAGIALDRNFFFLEDTSVRIDALSKTDVDFPGTEIKFWMQEITFDQLDRELRAAGNNRSASVRSDILLHVPPIYRSALGVPSDYVIFTGIQTGAIVEDEIEFESNLLFPWLDNRTFNRWFVPSGCDKPFGSLLINAANKVDFREKSLAKMFHFLKVGNMLNPPQEQMRLKIDSADAIVFCGYTCAGKTFSSQYLARKYGYFHVEASDFMHLAYLYRHGFDGEVSIGDFAEQALKYKPEIAAEKVLECIDTHDARLLIVSGFRAPAELTFLSRALSERGRDTKNYFLDANESLRFERLKARMRLGDSVTKEKFRSRDRQQARMGLATIAANDEVIHLENEGSAEEFFSKLDSQFAASGYEEISVSDSLEQVKNQREVKLEDAILISLLNIWNDSEARPYLTTTEISKLVKTTFPAALPKHKDNISRYFNQDFYAYYEIGGNKHHRKYRLSNTGYGMAIQALRRVAQQKLE